MALRWIFSFCVLTGLTLPVPSAGEEPAAKQPGAKSAAAPSPELVELLKKWEAAAPQGDVVEIEFERYIYDRTFYTEDRGIGRFVYHGPNQGLIELRPMPLERGQKSTRMDPDGRRYELRQIDPEIWYWDGKSINLIDMQEKTYRRILIPETVSKERPTTPDEISTAFASWIFPWGFFSKPHIQFPMVVDFDAEQLLQDYDWFAGKGNYKGISLTARPRVSPYRKEFKQIDLLIDEETMRTYAVRITDPTGSRRRVHVIKSVKTDAAEIGNWRPNLNEFKLIGNP